MERGQPTEWPWRREGTCSSGPHLPSGAAPQRPSCGCETHPTTRSKDVGASGHCGDQVTPPQPGKSLENCRSKFTVTRWHQSAIKTPKDKPQTKNPKPAQKGWVRTLKAFPLWPAHHAQAPANWLVPSSFRAGLLPQFASSHCQSPLEPPSQTRPHRHAHRMASHSCPLVTPRLQPIGW
jgi:hypothetical protein